MPSPWKHPKTGVFYVRVKAPKAVRSKVDYDTYQQTLGTKNLANAKVLLSEALAELNEEWARLLAEPGRLTRKQSKAIAGEFRSWFITSREDDPGKPDDLRRQIEHDRFCIRPPGRRVPSLGPVLGDRYHTFLKERGIVVHPDDSTRLAFDRAYAQVSAKETLLRYAMGDFSKAKDVDQYPEYVPAQPAAKQPARNRLGHASTGSALLSVEDHWDRFVAERDYALGTQKAFDRCCSSSPNSLGETILRPRRPPRSVLGRTSFWRRTSFGVKLSKSGFGKTHWEQLPGKHLGDARGEADPP